MCRPLGQGARVFHDHSTERFTALAEQVSGQDLDAFFQTWIHSPGRPPLP
ncbi:hypothetical protein ACFVH6_27180 [Spirillospora sp. NPDC127200]